MTTCFQFSCVHAKSLCNPVACSLPGSSVHGVLQARILERVSCSSLRDLSDPQCKSVSLEFPALAGRFFTTRQTRYVLTYLGVELLAHMAPLCLIFWAMPTCSAEKPNRLHCYQQYMGALMSFHPCQQLPLSVRFISHPSMYEMIYQYGLDLHFSNK